MIVHTRKKKYKNKAKRQAATSEYYQRIFDNMDVKKNKDKGAMAKRATLESDPTRPEAPNTFFLMEC